MLGSADVQTGATIAVAVLLVLLGVIAWFIRDLLAQVRAQVTENTRHLQGLMTAQWQTITRVATLEDEAADKLGYRPPRLYPDARPRDRDT